MAASTVSPAIVQAVPLVYASQWLYLSISFIVASILLTVYLSIKSNRKDVLYSRKIKPSYILFTGAFLACIAFLTPVIAQKEILINAIMLSFASTMRIFIMDGNAVDLQGVLLERYAVTLTDCSLFFCSFLFIYAPVLTLTTILSLISSFMSHLAYYMHPRREIYIFSELNNASVTLAGDILKSVKKGVRKAFIIFCDSRNEVVSPKLIRKAHAIGAVTVTRDILHMGLRFHSKAITHHLLFCAAIERQTLNMEMATEWIEIWKKKKHLQSHNISIYVFSTQDMSDLHLESLFDEDKDPNTGHNLKLEKDNSESGKPNNNHSKITSRTDIRKYGKKPLPPGYLPYPSSNLRASRVNIHREIIFNLLDEYPLFLNCRDGEDINILMVGGGQIGMEFVKAVCWCGQMNRHRKLVIYIIDEKETDTIKNHLWVACPDIMRNNEKVLDDSSEYHIRYKKYNIQSGEFYDFISTIPEITYVFVALGNDDLNIRTAADIRAAYTANQIKRGIFYPNGNRTPSIHLVVENDGKNTAVEFFNIGENEKYDLHPIGSDKCTYKKSIILHPINESLAFYTHLAYCEILNKFKSSLRSGKLYRKYQKDTAFLSAVDSFYDSEYNRRSSYAVAHHIKYVLYDAGCMDPDDMKTGQEGEESRIKTQESILARWAAFSSDGCTCGDCHKGERQIEDNKSAVLAGLRLEVIKKYETYIADFYNGEEYLKEDYTVVNHAKCLAVAEHRRWNAFMRTEGFSCASLDDVKTYFGVDRIKKEKFLLARLHPAIVPWEDPQTEKDLQALEKALKKITGKSKAYRLYDHNIIHQIPDIIEVAFGDKR